MLRSVNVGISPPSAVPSGWTQWSGYDPCCGFFVPATSAALPPPIAWTSCDSSVQPPGLRCRQMVANWGPPGSDPQPFGVGTASSVAADGTVMLAAERHVDVGGQTASFELVAEADGPVRQAMIWTLPTKCWAQIRSIQDGKVIYGVYENGGETGGGAFGGAVDSLYPTSFIKFADKLTHDYSAGTLGVVDDATMTLYAWQSTLTASAVLRWSGDQGLLDNHVFQAGPSVFWSASTLAIQKEDIWTPDGGSADLIGFGSDTSQGAVDLGTDGHDLVFLYGSGRTDPSGAFPQVAIMTAPFSTDPGQIHPRRLRSESATGFGVLPFKVGCGYAARALSNGIRVVRLSDGVSWVLPGGQGVAWQWTEPVAVTCNELFATVGIARDGSSISGYARIELNSLGPGLPPD